jgi:hypothetical protein
MKHRRFLLVVTMLIVAALACDLETIGQRPATPTATVRAVPTVTPGGVISVWLVSPTGAAAATERATPAAVAASPIPEVATATARAAVHLTATAEVARATQIATYQPSECPEEGNPLPPEQPTAFARYPEVIGGFLSAGGATTILESRLRQWGAITEFGGVVQADTDLTGDGVTEIVVALYDPNRAGQNPQPGQLLIFGCEKGGYRLLHNSTYDQTGGIPTLLRAGDMNGDTRAELVYFVEYCRTAPCTKEAQILTWNATLGSFIAMNVGVIEARGGWYDIGDPDSDGILEIVAHNVPAGGVERESQHLWDWDGLNYVHAVTSGGAPTYQIHAINDGDAAFTAGDLSLAADLYTQALTDPTLLNWTLLNERAVLNAYAFYRLVLVRLAQNDLPQARAMRDQVMATAPPGAPGAIFAEMADMMVNRAESGVSLADACTEVRAFAVTRPDVLSTLNGFGEGMRRYTIQDICPFMES